MFGILIFIGIIQAIIFGTFCRWLATQKGYDGMLWFLLGFLFSVLALIAIAGAPTKVDKDNVFVTTNSYGNSNSSDNKIWQCPKCGNKNEPSLFICKKCNYSLV
ncbi:MAG: hypothetical protein FJ218_10860 [Ignavibacteria bacterium]|nr:hypothetical protein [Ignavibacteria bacterium]